MAQTSRNSDAAGRSQDNYRHSRRARILASIAAIIRKAFAVIRISVAVIGRTFDRVADGRAPCSTAWRDATRHRNRWHNHGRSSKKIRNQGHPFASGFGRVRRQQLIKLPVPITQTLVTAAQARSCSKDGSLDLSIFRTVFRDTEPSLASFSSTGVGGPFAIATTGTAANFTLSRSSRVISFGTLTITPAALTITANDAAKTCGQTTTFAGTEFTVSALQNGESVGSVTLSSLGAAAAAGVAGSPYAIMASAATGSTFDPANYTIGYVDGHRTVMLPASAAPQRTTARFGDWILRCESAAVQPKPVCEVAHMIVAQGQTPSAMKWCN